MRHRPSMALVDGRQPPIRTMEPAQPRVDSAEQVDRASPRWPRAESAGQRGQGPYRGHRTDHRAPPWCSRRVRTRTSPRPWRSHRQAGISGRRKLRELVCPTCGKRDQVSRTNSPHRAPGPAHLAPPGVLDWIRGLRRGSASAMRRDIGRRHPLPPTAVRSSSVTARATAPPFKRTPVSLCRAPLPINSRIGGLPSLSECIAEVWIRHFGRARAPSEKDAGALAGLVRTTDREVPRDRNPGRMGGSTRCDVRDSHVMTLKLCGRPRLNGQGGSTDWRHACQCLGRSRSLPRPLCGSGTR
jgi:hypothetical protein